MTELLPEYSWYVGNCSSISLRVSCFDIDESSDEEVIVDFLRI